MDNMCVQQAAQQDITDQKPDSLLVPLLSTIETWVVTPAFY